MFAQLTALLDAEGAEFRVLAHAAEGNSVRVAQIRNTEIGQGAKAMICRMRGADFKVMAVVPGDRRVNLVRVAEHFGYKKSSFLPADEADRVPDRSNPSVFFFRKFAIGDGSGVGREVYGISLQRGCTEQFDNFVDTRLPTQYSINMLGVNKKLPGSIFTPAWEHTALVKGRSLRSKTSLPLRV